MKHEISCYIHIPFCRSKCPYCDFYSLGLGHSEATCSPQARQAYVDRCVALLQAQDCAWRTAYIGGGTPSVLPPELLLRLLAAVRVAPGGEFTIECNPTSVTRDFCRAIAEGGVNRVSLGLQSAVPEERRALGRAGDCDALKRALEYLRGEGIENISLDVMLGIPHQNRKSLQETLRFCQAQGAKHISAYLLKLEPGTAFGRAPPQGLPDEDAQAALYLAACDWLEAQGYAQYEISNFARPGYESRHNLNIWRCGEYYAIGPAAHGFTQGRRWHYEADLAAFLQGSPPVDDGPGGGFEERAMLALRLREGILSPPAEMLARARGLAGYVEIDQQGLHLTREGFLLSNTIIGKLLF